VYTRPVRTRASRLPLTWPRPSTDAGATASSTSSRRTNGYFYAIQARLERDLRKIRAASMRWQTGDAQPDASSEEADASPRSDEWQSYYVFFLRQTATNSTSKTKALLWNSVTTCRMAPSLAAARPLIRHITAR
jgi:hypothetical protein